MSGEYSKVIQDQIARWTAEISRIASLIAYAQGRPCAVALITPTGEGYEDVISDYVLEDAFAVGARGWPEGFDINLLNPGQGADDDEKE